MKGEAGSNFLLYFLSESALTVGEWGLVETFHHRKKCERNLREGYWGHEILWPQPRHVTKPSTQSSSPPPPKKKITPLTSTILTTPPKFHSSTPLSSKQKKPPKEQLSHWNTKAHPKSQSPQTNQKMIFTTSHITFTPPTLQQLPQQTHMPSFTFPTIFQSVEQCGATGHHPEKA